MFIFIIGGNGLPVSTTKVNKKPCTLFIVCKKFYTFATE